MHIPEDKLKLYIVKRMFDDNKLVNFMIKYDAVDLIDDRFGEFIAESVVELYKMNNMMPRPTTIINKATVLVEEENRRVEKYSMSEFEQYWRKVFAIPKAEIEDGVFYESLISYIKRKGCYRAISDAIDITSHDHPELTKIIPEFERFAGVALEDEIGFDFYAHQNQLWDDIDMDEAMIATGIDDLDNKIGGGVCRNGKGLWVFLGQPNVGKSLILSNIAVNMDAAGVKVAILSLEMSEMMYGKRCLAHITEHNINRLKNQRHRLTSIVTDHHNKSNGSIIIKENPPSSMNCRDIRRYLEMLRDAGRLPEVLFVDYLGLLIPNERTSEGSHWRIGEICKELRALSFEFEIPIITAAQLNGDGYDTDEITMANVAESKAINMHSDFMGALYQLDGDMEQGILNMKILKSRFGSRTESKVTMNISYESLRISNISPEDYVKVNCTDVLDGEFAETADRVIDINAMEE